MQKTYLQVLYLLLTPNPYRKKYKYPKYSKLKSGFFSPPSYRKNGKFLSFSSPNCHTSKPKCCRKKFYIRKLDNFCQCHYIPLPVTHSLQDLVGWRALDDYGRIKMIRKSERNQPGFPLLKSIGDCKAHIGTRRQCGFLKTVQIECIYFYISI